MSVYVTGDTHGDMDIHKLNMDNWFEQKDLTPNDLLIILGDFGLFWSNIPTKEEKFWLKWLLNKPCQIAFLDGNHENHQLINSFPTTEKWGGQVHECFKHNGKTLYHLMRGEVYMIDGRSIFVMGGAYSIDKYHRTEGLSWWPEEIPSSAEWNNADANLWEHYNKVDYVLAHTAPRSILVNMGYIHERISSMYGSGYESHKWDCSVSKMFDNLLPTIEFKEWHFGHFHRDEVYRDKFFCHYEKFPHKLF